MQKINQQLIEYSHFCIIFRTYFHWRLNGFIYKPVGVETNRHKLLIFRATGIHTHDRILEMIRLYVACKQEGVITFCV